MDTGSTCAETIYPGFSTYGRSSNSMARVKNNIVTSGLAGAVGRQIVFRRGKGGQTIVSNMPHFDPDRELSPAQQAHHAAFQQAAAYAKLAQSENVYIDMASGTPRSAYNIAIGDWFHKPQIKNLDVTGWNGGRDSRSAFGSSMMCR